MVFRTVVGLERTLTLALPKTGLANVGGELYLADIGITVDDPATLPDVVAHIAAHHGSLWVRASGRVGPPRAARPPGGSIVRVSDDQQNLY